ncbi:MAG: TIM barrel protein [Pirellulaceae bacterium]
MLKNRIHQSVMGWCFKPMLPLELGELCRKIGIPAIEGVSSKFYPQLMKMGLKISLVSSHGFRKGFCDVKLHDECVETLEKNIDLARDIGTQNVITFTGMLPENVDRETATRNCVRGLKKIVGYAEKRGITLVLEHLNSRDNTHPMKGHPGYFGDDVDHVVEMIRQVGSPHLKLLFDIYHVQIMNGDVVRRIRQYHEYIGHYHTAGCPGRGELDDRQEINYPYVMKAILETGFQGYVAQEFIPTWEDSAAALEHAVQLCDIGG